MKEKIKEKINKEKKNRTVHFEYVKSFCESEKAQELFKNDENFKDLKKFVKM